MLTYERNPDTGEWLETRHKVTRRYVTVVNPSDGRTQTARATMTTFDPGTWYVDVASYVDHLGRPGSYLAWGEVHRVADGYRGSVTYGRELPDRTFPTLAAAVRYVAPVMRLIQ